MKKIITDVEVLVDVEVDLDEFSTEELEEELRFRRDAEDSDPRTEIFYALKLGKEEHALKLMREYLCELTGKIL